MPTVNLDVYKKLLIPFSFLITLLVVYTFDPNSFLDAWKGRAFYLFFLWLFALEFILGNPNPKPSTRHGVEWARLILGAFILMIPTIYIIETNIYGLNSTIIEIGKSLGVGQGLSEGGAKTYLINVGWPLSVEYLIVAASIFLAILAMLHFEGIKQFPISMFLLGMMGVFYMIDTFRPYGTATIPNFLIPLISPSNNFSIQSLVPLTSSAVAIVLQNMGRAVQMIVQPQDGGVQMLVSGSPTVFGIYWPCAGIHSLFIYTFVILIFLKGSPLSLTGKAACLAVGAVGTFFVNVLRIVSIINIYIAMGPAAGDYFHNYYGELFFLAWIVVYLFALVFVQRFLTNRSSTNNTRNTAIE
jgi:exosortase/archaeosortase family protein